MLAVTESYAAQVSLFQQPKTGADSRIRTDDLLITNQLLYQLSYAGEKEPRRLPYKAAVNKLLVLLADARIRGERFRRLQILDDGAEIHRFGIKGFVLCYLGAI